MLTLTTSYGQLSRWLIADRSDIHYANDNWNKAWCDYDRTPCLHSYLSNGLVLVWCHATLDHRTSLHYWPRWFNTVILQFFCSLTADSVQHPSAKDIRVEIRVFFYTWLIFKVYHEWIKWIYVAIGTTHHAIYTESCFLLVGKTKCLHLKEVAPAQDQRRICTEVSRWHH